VLSVRLNLIQPWEVLRDYGPLIIDGGEKRLVRFCINHINGTSKSRLEKVKSTKSN